MSFLKSCLVSSRKISCFLRRIIPMLGHEVNKVDGQGGSKFNHFLA